MPRISVVMTTYNGEKYVAQQIQSILNQSFRDFELIIRDDGSKDDTPVLLDELAQTDSRIRVLSDNLGNLGFNKNFFEVMRHAQSDYIMFSDQDDVWDESKIEKLVSLAQSMENEYPGVPVLVYCDARIVSADMQLIADHFVRRRTRKTGLAAMLMVNSVQGASMLANRQLIQEARQHDPLLPFDFHTGLIAEATGKRVFLNESLMSYRQHRNNVFGAGIGKVVPKKEGVSPFFSESFAWGLHVGTAIGKTLEYVRADWNPGVEKTLENHARFLQPGFSLYKVWLCFTMGYCFSRRKDYLLSFFHAIGLDASMSDESK